MKIHLSFLLGLIFFQTGQSQSPTTDSLNKQVKEIQSDLNALKRLKVTGWVQAQFQFAENRGIANYEGGTFAANSDKRFMIRRGRIKFTYNGVNTQYVMQVNATERGVSLTDFYALATDPWLKVFSVAAGVMNRPFGFEIEQSSSVRENPERSRYTQILMPNERDLGAKLIVQAPAKSKLHGLRLDAGFYNGEGIYVPGTTTPANFPAGTTPVMGLNEFDFEKDFIGRLSFYRTANAGKIQYGIGTSHYNGGILEQNNRVYDHLAVNNDGYKYWAAADTSNKVYKNHAAPRIYYGGEAFFSFKNPAGTTTLRGEYITGTQPGTSASSASPFFLNTASADTYLRNFTGMYAFFIHRYKKHEVAFRYEFYDPNTKVKGGDIGHGNNLSAADIRYDQYGFTYTHYTFENVKFMFHYTIVRNEATALSAYLHDLKDNVLTIRMQCRF